MEFFDLSLDGRTAVLGIGNENKGDDSAGIEVMKRLQKEVKSPQNLIIDGSNVPEKFTSKIKDFEPDNIVLVDAVDSGEYPGTITLVDPNDIIKENISSHRLPLSMLMKYLENETNSRVILMGIQPNQVAIGAEMSKPVKEAIDDLVKLLVKKLNG